MTGWFDDERYERLTTAYSMNWNPPRVAWRWHLLALFEQPYHRLLAEDIAPYLPCGEMFGALANHIIDDWPDDAFPGFGTDWKHHPTWVTFLAYFVAHELGQRNSSYCVFREADMEMLCWTSCF